MLTKRGQRSHAAREHPERCDHLDNDNDNDNDATGIPSSLFPD
jgi:hypothetical protein